MESDVWPPVNDLKVSQSNGNVGIIIEELFIQSVA